MTVITGFISCWENYLLGEAYERFGTQGFVQYSNWCIKV
jgi:hypothetical protein